MTALSIFDSIERTNIDETKTDSSRIITAGGGTGHL